MRTTFKSFDRPFVHIILIVILGILAYSNTFNVPFILDDNPTIVDNVMIRDLSNVPIILAGKSEIFASMPLMHATFAANYYFGGLDPTGYHAVNVALHLISGLLLYLLVTMTGRHLGYEKKSAQTVALMSSALFVVHPVQTEAVTNVVNRSMLLATMFYLAGLILFLKAATADGRKSLYITGLFVVSILGMGSREDFAVFPVVLLLYDLFFISRLRLKTVAGHWKAYLPVILSLSYFAHLVLNSTYVKRDVIPGIPPSEYALTQFSIQWTYLRLLLLPVGQNLGYDYPVARTLFDFPTILAFVGYLGLWGISIFQAKKRPLMSFPVLWFLITLLPVSFMLALTDMKLDDVIFEHRAYLPSAGIFTALAISMISLIKTLQPKKAKVASIIMLASVPLVFASATYVRNGVWQSELSIWHDVVRKSHGNARGWNDMGVGLVNLGRHEKALRAFENAAGLKPDYVEAWYNRGLALGFLGRHDEAINAFEKAIELRPDYATAWYNKGVGLVSLSRPEEALRAFERAIELKPGHAEAWYNRGLVLGFLGRHDEAINAFEKAIELKPDYAEVRYILMVEKNKILSRPAQKR